MRLLAAWQALANAGIWPELPPAGTVDRVRHPRRRLRDGHLLGGDGQPETDRHRLRISLAIGLVLGLLLGTLRRFDETLGSLVLGLQALPSVCWLPLSIVWMGLNERAIIFVVVMGALFSITLGVRAG